MDSKKCNGCDTVKPLVDFNRDNRSKGGYQTKCKECQKLYYIKNRARYQELKKKKSYREKMREYQIKNADKINEYKRRRYRTIEGNAKVRASNARRRAMKKSTCDGSVDYKFILHLLEKQNYKCAISGVDITESYHIDHIIPLSKGGKHTKDNIQLLSPSVNMSKKDKIDYKL